MYVWSSKELIPGAKLRRTESGGKLAKDIPAFRFVWLHLASQPINYRDRDLYECASFWKGVIFKMPNGGISTDDNQRKGLQTRAPTADGAG